MKKYYTYKNDEITKKNRELSKIEENLIEDLLKLKTAFVIYEFNQ